MEMGTGRKNGASGRVGLRAEKGVGMGNSFSLGRMEIE
jgi:hypothetical protein